MSPRSPSARPWFFCLATWAFACTPDRLEPPATASASPSTIEASPSSGMVAGRVPTPRLDELESEAREQILNRRSELGRLLATGASPVVLGNAYGAMGQSYHAHAFNEAASACYEQASRLLPQDPRWPYYLGHLAIRGGDFESALVAFERSRALRPQDPQATIWSARALWQLGRAREAETLLRRLLAVDPGNAVASFLLGQLAAERGDFAAAVLQYEAALRAQPQASRIHYPLAVALQRLGRPEQARRHLAQRGEREPAIPDPLLQVLAEAERGILGHLSRGGLQMRAGRLREALIEFRAATAADPTSSSAALNLGAALAQSGEHAEALAELERAQGLEMSDPERSKLHFNLGNLYLQQRRVDAARAHFRKSVEADPGNLAAQRRLVQLEAAR